ncbi:hypothetical protein Tco_0867424, partial [Tanacetum coccineum]
SELALLVITWTSEWRQRIRRSRSSLGSSRRDLGHGIIDRLVYSSVWGLALYRIEGRSKEKRHGVDKLRRTSGKVYREHCLAQLEKGILLCSYREVLKVDKYGLAMFWPCVSARSAPMSSCEVDESLDTRVPEWFRDRIRPKYVDASNDKALRHVSATVSSWCNNDDENGLLKHVDSAKVLGRQLAE